MTTLQIINILRASKGIQACKIVFNSSSMKDGTVILRQAGRLLDKFLL
jgi:hypothetical protein